jgi:hypothetical protein
MSLSLYFKSSARVRLYGPVLPRVELQVSSKRVPGQALRQSGPGIHEIRPLWVTGKTPVAADNKPTPQPVPPHSKGIVPDTFPFVK